ncbi:MAG: hypothetical protein ABI667_07025 [Sphingomicrobium sp.]
MRHALAFLPLLIIAAPAVAAPKHAPQLPPELTDPAMGEKLGRMAGALSKTLLDVKVGEVAAIAQGRQASPAEKNRTVRDMAMGSDPNAERRLQQQVAAAVPVLQNSMTAMARALPAIMGALEDVSEELERATANLPQPGYPRR